MQRIANQAPRWLFHAGTTGLPEVDTIGNPVTPPPPLAHENISQPSSAEHRGKLRTQNRERERRADEHHCRWSLFQTRVMNRRGVFGSVGLQTVDAQPSCVA
jgi:hypothetical protein